MLFLSEKYKKAVSATLVLSMLGSFLFIPVRRAEAAGGIAGCAGLLIIGLISLFSDEVPTKDYAQNLKEQCMDALFYVLNEIVIKEITKSTIDWINSGFNGNPAYVENLDQFSEDVADHVFSEFIEGSELEFMCSPFRLQIKKALILNNRRNYNGRSAFANQVSCRLSDVTSNINNFLSGDFADGGWDAWQVLTEDNPYSQYIRVSAELQARTENSQANEEKKLEFGKGFLSYEQCPDGTGGNPATSDTSGASRNVPQDGGVYAKGSAGSSSGGEEPKDKPEGPDDKPKPKEKPKCKVVTPGSVIEEQLNNTLGTGQRRLEMADEFNEIVDALLAYLVTKALTKGLRSLSKSGDSNKSYTESLQDNNAPAGGEAAEGLQSDFGNSGAGGNSSESPPSSGSGNREIIPPEIKDYLNQYPGFATSTGY